MPKKGLKGDLDTVFSQFIKMRDDWTCRKCGLRSVPGSRYYDPAHMVGRVKESVRWDEKNVFGMDRKCHRWMDDHPREKKLWYITTFGQVEWDNLLARAWPIMHFKDYHIQVMITDFKERIKNHEFT